MSTRVYAVNTGATQFLAGYMASNILYSVLYI